MGKPAWLNREVATRKKSDKQETKLAKQFGGRKTAGSGSVFHENDVKTADFEIEAKVTDSKQYILKSEVIKSMNKKCRFDKIALLIVEFAQDNEEIVILRKSDFLTLTNINDI